MSNFYSGARVLLCGGAGMIGSHLAEFLVADGAKVTIADDFSRGKVRNLTVIRDRIRLIEGDLTRPEVAAEACRGQEVVINLAAKVTGIHYNAGHHFDMAQANLALQREPLVAAVNAGVNRFCQVSTACVYPHDAPVPTPEEWGHRGEPEPTNRGYGWAKRVGERLAEWAAAETQMECCIVRPFNAYGPRDYFDERSSHVIPALIRKVLSGNRPIEVWGSGNQTRVFVHARDVAKGILLVTEHAKDAAPVNVGHDRQVSIRELLQVIQEEAGTNHPVFYNCDMPEGYPARAAETTRLKAVTGGWEPETDLREGVREMVALERQS